MKEPDIRYCSNGHIYDASLNEECPYCKKANENKEKLNSMLKEQAVRNISSAIISDDSDETELLIEPDDDSDKTELLIEPDDDSDETELLIEQDDDSDETELLIEQDDDSDETEWLTGPDNDSDETELLIDESEDEATLSDHDLTMKKPDEDSEDTELLLTEDTTDADRHSDLGTAPETNSPLADTVSKMKNKIKQQVGKNANYKKEQGTAELSVSEYVQGWLVCISGKEKGMSYPLAMSNQFALSGGSEGTVICRPYNAETNDNDTAFKIARKNSGEFSLNSQNGRAFNVDGIRFTRQKKLYPYAHIEIIGREYVFVPFVCDKFDWEE